MNREPFKRDSRITGGQRESPSLHESSLRSSYVNPLSDSNDHFNIVQPSSYMQRSPSPVVSPCKPHCSIRAGLRFLSMAPWSDVPPACLLAANPCSKLL